MSPDARITWLCQPRPDGPALFGELLGGPPGGYFAIRPASKSNALRQRYIGDSMAVETTFPHLRVIDLLERVGDVSELVRTIDGDTPAVVEFAPRPDYARMPFDLRLHPRGIELVAGSDTLLLVGPDCGWEIDRGHRPIARATVDPTNGPVTFRMRLNAVTAVDPQPDHEDRLRAHCIEWDTWVEGLQLPTRRRPLLARSAVTLRALTYEPTGAILAAATTSLPESIGGPRNWDYRYCWLRDAALTATTLLTIGSREEAVGLLDWIANIVERVGIERLRPLYAVDGSEIPPEGIIESLSGYADSRPIRIGNAAEYQTQLDVIGHVVELALAAAHHDLTDDRWLRVVDECMKQIERRWHEPDHGIWEIRDLPRHHVYSKVRCWAAAGAALELDAHGNKRATEWKELRDEIARDVELNGWKPSRNAFGAAYDGTDLDAAALHVGLSGMIAADDPRFVSTIDAVEHDLRHRATVLRYDRDDGLPGFEGGFHLCALWL
ncbi:MAG TPA: trehalase-like domain-containing protein, partial [Acidimicrobiia bacterium]